MRATARHQTPYGLAECAWAIEAGEFRMTVVVPPNTTARVFFPRSDAAPVEVGSGTHHWSYPYQEPATTRSLLSLDSTLGEIIGDSGTWTAVLSTIARHFPGLAEQMAAGAGISGNSGLTLRQAILMRPNSDALYRELESMFQLQRS
jgi:alpha-L-rhamnosidase